MYFDDAPIKKQNEDLLNRHDFAKHLGKSLLKVDAKNGYCVGLYGQWGSGKTSIINMIIEEIKLLSAYDEKSVIVMSFEPWKFSSSDQLLRQYFVMLADRLNTTKDKQLSKIGEYVQRYAGMLDVFGDVGKVIGSGGRLFGKILQRKGISSDNDITKQRDRIVESLLKQECKIIVVIDDIDRLSNKEIKLVFQLVNSVAKFPNIIYLLSFDKEIVTRALAEIQNCDGERYLEKIIQVPIEVPLAANSHLWSILFNRLNSILENHTGMIFEKEYWNRVFYECVSKYVHTIRDIVRIINGLNIKCDMISENINFADMIAITVIENKIPELYRWIKNNKAKLVGTPEIFLKFIGKNEKDIANIYMEDMRRLNVDRCEEYMDILKFLFPYYASKLSGNKTYYPNENLRRSLRIGHEEIFDRYFALELDTGDVSRKDVNFAIESMNDGELQNYLYDINCKKEIISFLNELKAVKYDIPQKRIGMIVRALFNTGVAFEGESKISYLGIDASTMALYTIRDILMNLDTEEERYELLKSIIQNANSDSIQMLSKFIKLIELAYGRLAAKGVENGGAKVVSLEQLEDCEKELVKKFYEISNVYSIFEMRYASQVLYMYNTLDNENYLKYMSRCLEDDIIKLKYIGYSAEKWTSGSAVSWGSNEEYKTLISDDVFEQTINNCLRNKSIWTLSQEELHRVIALLMWKENAADWDGHISDKKVEKKINELRSIFV